jgi:uncharacterized protein with GYD domain
MPLFITQGRLTRENIKGALARPEDRHVAIAKMCEQAGGKLIFRYFTLGQYDFLVLSDMPDAKAAATIAFLVTAAGSAQKTVTTQAFTTTEATELFEYAGKIVGSYKPMGA